MEFSQDESDLWWVVPVTRLQPVFNSGQFGDVLDWEGFLLLKVTKQIQNIDELVFALNSLMLFENLCEEHLSNPDHTSPSSIRNIRTNQLVGKFGKACPIGDPGRGHKNLDYLVLNLCDIVFGGKEIMSKYMNLVLRL